MPNLYDRTMAEDTLTVLREIRTLLGEISHSLAIRDACEKPAGVLHFDANLSAAERREIWQQAEQTGIIVTEHNAW